MIDKEGTNQEEKAAKITEDRTEIHSKREELKGDTSKKIMKQVGEDPKEKPGINKGKKTERPKTIGTIKETIMTEEPNKEGETETMAERKEELLKEGMTKNMTGGQEITEKVIIHK